MAFSPPYRKIIYCDSIATLRPADHLERKDNLLLLAYFMFPFITTYDWELEKIHDADSFQNSGLHNDCGFHVLNFANAAIDNDHIENDILLFSQFKQVTARKYHINRDDFVAD